MKRWWLIAGVFLIAVIGYGVMHLIVYLFPMTQDSFATHLIVTLIIIALGLAVPYWMLKTSFFEAHLADGREKNIQLKDIPKDKDQVKQS